MIIKKDKNTDRIIRHERVRRNIKPGTAECPRLSVYRSTNHIYAQIIDDSGTAADCCEDTTAVEAFDATFPPKEKKWMPSQEEFYIYSHSSVVR